MRFCAISELYLPDQTIIGDIPCPSLRHPTDTGPLNTPQIGSGGAASFPAIHSPPGSCLLLLVLRKPDRLLGIVTRTKKQKRKKGRQNQRIQLETQLLITTTKMASENASNPAPAPSKLSYSTDPALYIYTSLTAGSSHIVTATSRLETILRANKVPFKAIDLATDEKARMLWGRRSGKDESGRVRKLPGLVQEGTILGVGLFPSHLFSTMRY